MANIKRSDVTIVPTYVPRGAGNDPSGGKRDLHYKIKEWGYVFPSKESAEEYARTHKQEGMYIVKRGTKR